MSDTKTIDLGCGNNKRDPDAIGVDIREYPDVDIVTDIEEGLPFETSSVDRVLAYSVLEHLGNVPGLMAEIHRVGRPGATVDGKVPHWRDRHAYIDPTHEVYAQLWTGEVFPVPWHVAVGEDRYEISYGRPVAGFDEKTFDFWDSTTRLGERDYFDAEFRVKSAHRINRVRFWKSRPIAFELVVVK